MVDILSCQYDNHYDNGNLYTDSGDIKNWHRDDWRLSVRPLLTSIPTRDILVNYKTPILINVFSIAIGNIAEFKMKRERGARRQIISTFGKTFPQNTVVCLFTMILP